MKNIFCASLFLFCFYASAQKYYPKLNNLFIETSGEESLFGTDLNYFREGLRAATNKVFYGNLQTSNNGNAAFYSMKVIPRFISEFNILETGVFLKFNATSKEEYPSFPLIANVLVTTNDSGIVGTGNIKIGNAGLILKFNPDEIIAFDLEKNKAIENLAVEFTINDIEYKIQEKSLLTIDVHGNFNSDLKIKKKKFSKDKIYLITITVTKNDLEMSFLDSATNQKITLVKKTGITKK